MERRHNKRDKQNCPIDTKIKKHFMSFKHLTICSQVKSSTMYCLLLLLVGLSLSSCDVTVLKNQNIDIKCLPDNAPKLADFKYIWSFKPAQSLLPHTLEGAGDKILHLKNVKASDEGEYRCVQVGWKGDDRVKLGRTITLHVKEPPVFQEWQVVKITAGDDVILPCHFPKLTKSSPVVWKRAIKGGMVELNPSKEDTEEVPEVLSHKKKDMKEREFWVAGTEEQDRSIKIIQVTEGDAGIYHCIIKKTSETQLVELEVDAPPVPRCQGNTDPWETCPDPNNRSWKQILQESITDFSTTVYSHLSGPKPITNLIISPVSIAAALSNLLLGARGETRKQLEDALKLPNNFSCVHSEMRRLKQTMKDSLPMASTVFYSPEQKLQTGFINQSREFYDAEPQKLSEDSDQNVKLINDWVAEKTNKKITNLVDEVDASTVLVLLNAVYFNGKWKSNFETLNRKGGFKTFSGEAVSVPILHSSKHKIAMSFNQKLMAEVGKFPLTGNNSLFILVQPTVSEVNFIKMEKNLDFSTIAEMVSDMMNVPYQTTEVKLPKIKLSVTTPLEKLLTKLGLSSLSNTPNLCGLFPEDSGPSISDARHRAFLSLTEKGVEAAAATSISFARSFSNFVAMQPFILIVWNDEVGVPLFIGRVVNPNQDK